MRNAKAQFFNHLLALLFVAPGVHAEPDTAALAQGVALRHAGNLQQAIDRFAALRGTGDAAGHHAATGELGATLLQARRYDEAEPYLREAYEKAQGADRARHAIELGNLAAARRRAEDARHYFEESRQLVGSMSAFGLVARIGAARLTGAPERLALLKAISSDLMAVAEPLARARMRLTVGVLASESGSLQMAHENLDEARQLAAQAGDMRIEVEAQDALAQLYEGQHRFEEALLLSRRALARAQAAQTGVYTDIQVRLEWRQGRLLAAQGASEPALAAYQRAIEHIESIRQDIPIEYDNGRSSFRDTLEPIFLGRIDLLLKKADKAPSHELAALLRQARDVAELIKQSELQDYLGERCSVDSVQDETRSGLIPGTAIFYPIVLKDRVELIFESGAGMRRHTTPMDAQSLRKLMSSYTSLLRAGAQGYQREASQLYDILIRPFEKEVAAQEVHTLLVVPDGVLRLLPWATLHDGKQFLVEKYSVVTNSGLSMTSQAAAPITAFTSLVAGMAEPGPVVGKLSQSTLARIVNSTTTRSGVAVKHVPGRAMRSLSLSAAISAGSESERIASLKDSLSLPGVKQEVEALSQILPGTSLLDGSFTTARLRDEFDKGGYRIAHVATHGFFGSTADQSYIMAYDDLVTMDGLQKLLQLDGVKKHPIELLTLSACETAEGDDRSPLGIAGAAIKAKAKSVLGTLWPVSDEAAKQVMTSFYSNLVRDGVSKAEALRRAQVALITDSELQHPLFWAPFVLVGNWR